MATHLKCPSEITDSFDENGTILGMVSLVIVEGNVGRFSDARLAFH